MKFELIGHSLFNWFTYALTIIPVLSHITAIYSLLTLLTYLILLLPPTWQGTSILLTFLLGVSYLQPEFCKPRQRSYRPPWKRATNFRQRRLHTSLVIRCQRRIRQHPCRLNGSFFPSPLCSKHRRWRRRKSKERARHKWRRTVTRSPSACG